MSNDTKQRINVEKGFCQINDGQIYPCFYTLKRQHWNGWAVPLLEESVYENWIESIDDGSEEIKEMREEHTPVEVYEVSTGKFLKCYGREFGYCWDEVTEQGLDPSEYRGCDYGDDTVEEKTFNIRVRQESVGYFTVKAVNLREAEKMASTLMSDEAPCPIEEFEEFNPADYGDD